MKSVKDAICSNTVTTRDYHTKWSEVRERQISYAPAYMWDLKTIHKWIQIQREIDQQTENKLWLPKGKWGEGWIRRLELTYTHYYIRTGKQ